MPDLPFENGFDAELSGGSGSLFARLYGDQPPSRVVASTRHFVVVADLSPLVAGHLLVIPRRDISSFAQVTDDEWADWRVLRASLVDRLSSHWRTPIVFEHGSTEGMRGSACITHAHLHLLPADVDMMSRIEGDGLELSPVRGFREIPFAASSPYFFVEVPGHEPLVARADYPAMPSQYLRRVAASELGIPDPEWDWGVVVRRELLRETVSSLVRTPDRQ